MDARFALLHILQLGQPTVSAQEYGDVFMTATAGARLEQLIREFFGAYLEHALQRFLYEHLTQRVGHDEALASIASTTRVLWQRVGGLPFPQVPGAGWASPEGQQTLSAYLAMMARQTGSRGSE